MLITREDLEQNIKLTFVSNTYINDAKRDGIVSVRDDELDLNKTFYIETGNNWHMITETDLRESDLTAKDIEKAALEGVKNSKLITASLIDMASYLTGFLMPIDPDEYIKVIVAKAVTENNVIEGNYRTFVEIPYGSSVIYNSNLLDEVCKSVDAEEIIILPCSTNEIICLPAIPDVIENIDSYKAIIKKVDDDYLGYNTELSNIPYSYKIGSKVTKYETERDQDMER